jgi:hypothetical protein
MKTIDEFRPFIIAFCIGWIIVPTFKFVINGTSPSGVDFGGFVAFTIIYIATFFFQKKN